MSKLLLRGITRKRNGDSIQQQMREALDVEADRACLQLMLSDPGSAEESAAEARLAQLLAIVELQLEGAN